MRVPSGVAPDTVLAWIVTLAVVALAAWKVAAGLDPDSLFLDDQWVGIALDRMSPAERFAYHLPMPLAFGLLEALPGLFVDDPELALQVVPVVAYVASIPLFAAILWRLTGVAWAAALGSAVIAASPLVMDLAVRAKHYTTDQLAMVVVLLVMAGLFTPGREVTPRRFLPAVAALLACFLFSFVSVFLGAAAVLVAVTSAWRSGTLGARDRRTVALLAAGFFACVTSVYLLDLRYSSRPIMVEFWAGYFPDLSSWRTVWSFLTQRVYTFLHQALPSALGPLLLLTPLGLVGLWRIGRVRYAAALCLFFLALLGAAVFRVYPLGTGRTDAFAVSVIGLLVCMGVVEIASRISDRFTRALVFAGVVAVFAGVKATTRGAVYFPQTADRPVVAWARERLGPEDGLVLGPYGVYALDFYTESPMSVVPADYYGHGFDLEPERPRTIKTFIGRWGLTDAEELQAEVDRLVGFLREGYGRVVYLETNGFPGSRETMMSIITQSGYRLAERTDFGGNAEAFLFVAEPG